MDAGAYRRRSWVACPRCGHKAAKVQSCDMEVKCPQCSYVFEVIIGPSAEKVQDNVEKERADPSNKKPEKA